MSLASSAEFSEFSVEGLAISKAPKGLAVHLAWNTLNPCHFALWQAHCLQGSALADVDASTPHAGIGTLTPQHA
jgi:hypothetical protein